ncbi:GNAT family N-acetyltransferase [Dysgonomonas sp. Marseille-P4677]|uniref:GNAT family N-acetyltransferase n=1 Tax=Dysgonomonas sp. Marseille-P4677 TaxID=2364790 RepID=UPI00191427E9|nr:GNAT family N-acetyltransferase [Dysgonomonas sp. Marseille-P4677]MBK5721806.1 GNAT family N-acetyltransferase [Dysgonomonas sp. Marseille-P4677]
MKKLLNIEKLKDVMMDLLNVVPFNTLFAKCVINQIVKGDIFVDDEQNPKTFYILHPYGMSLLLGDSNNEVFNCAFKEYVLNSNKCRNRVEWMQAFPDNWHIILNNLFKNKGAVDIDTRINFKFNSEMSLHSEANYEENNLRIVATSKIDFENMAGSVIPKLFWNDADDFIKYGKGYSLFYENNLVSMAFSSAIDDLFFELGIETKGEFRGKNFAYQVCSHLIRYCLENGFEPVWACRLTNIGSYRLAQKLGFEESLRIPYYTLNY